MTVIAERGRLSNSRAPGRLPTGASNPDADEDDDSSSVFLSSSEYSTAETCVDTLSIAEAASDLDNKPTDSFSSIPTLNDSNPNLERDGHMRLRSPLFAIPGRSHVLRPRGPFLWRLFPRCIRATTSEVCIAAEVSLGVEPSECKVTAVKDGRLIPVRVDFLNDRQASGDDCDQPNRHARSSSHSAPRYPSVFSAARHRAALSASQALRSNRPDSEIVLIWVSPGTSSGIMLIELHAPAPEGASNSNSSARSSTPASSTVTVAGLAASTGALESTWQSAPIQNLTGVPVISLSTSLRVPGSATATVASTTPADHNTLHNDHYHSVVGSEGGVRSILHTAAFEGISSGGQRAVLGAFSNGVAALSGPLLSAAPLSSPGMLQPAGSGGSGSAGGGRGGGEAGTLEWGSRGYRGLCSSGALSVVVVPDAGMEAEVCNLLAQQHQQLPLPVTSTTTTTTARAAPSPPTAPTAPPTAPPTVPLAPLTASEVELGRSTAAEGPNQGDELAASNGTGVRALAGLTAAALSSLASSGAAGGPYGDPSGGPSRPEEPPGGAAMEFSLTVSGSSSTGLWGPAASGGQRLADMGATAEWLAAALMASGDGEEDEDDARARERFLWDLGAWLELTARRAAAAALAEAVAEATATDALLAASPESPPGSLQAHRYALDVQVPTAFASASQRHVPAHQHHMPAHPHSTRHLQPPAQQHPHTAPPTPASGPAPIGLLSAGWLGSVPEAEEAIIIDAASDTSDSDLYLVSPSRPPRAPVTTLPPPLPPLRLATAAMEVGMEATEEPMPQSAIELLGFACSRGWPATSTHIVLGLMDMGDSMAVINAAVKAAHGWSALHLAVASGSQELVGMTALWRSYSRYGDGAAVQEEWRGMLAAPGPGGLTPLHLAAVLPPPATAALDLLSSLPAETLSTWFGVPALDGCTPAHYASRAGNANLNDHALLCLAMGTAALDLDFCSATCAELQEILPYDLDPELTADATELTESIAGDHEEGPLPAVEGPSGLDVHFRGSSVLPGGGPGASAGTGAGVSELTAGAILNHGAGSTVLGHYGTSFGMAPPAMELSGLAPHGAAYLAQHPHGGHAVSVLVRRACSGSSGSWIGSSGLGGASGSGGVSVGPSSSISTEGGSGSHRGSVLGGGDVATAAATAGAGGGVPSSGGVGIIQPRVLGGNGWLRMRRAGGGGGGGNGNGSAPHSLDDSTVCASDRNDVTYGSMAAVPAPPPSAPLPPQQGISPPQGISPHSNATAAAVTTPIITASTTTFGTGRGEVTSVPGSVSDPINGGLLSPFIVDMDRQGPGGGWAAAVQPPPPPQAYNGAPAAAHWPAAQVQPNSVTTNRTRVTGAAASAAAAEASEGMGLLQPPQPPPPPPPYLTNDSSLFNGGAVEADTWASEPWLPLRRTWPEPSQIIVGLLDRVSPSTSSHGSMGSSSPPTWNNPANPALTTRMQPTTGGQDQGAQQPQQRLTMPQPSRTGSSSFTGAAAAGLSATRGDGADVTPTYQPLTLEEARIAARKLVTSAVHTVSSLSLPYITEGQTAHDDALVVLGGGAGVGGVPAVRSAPPAMASSRVLAVLQGRGSKALPERLVSQEHQSQRYRELVAAHLKEQIRQQRAQTQGVRSHVMGPLPTAVLPPPLRSGPLEEGIECEQTGTWPLPPLAPAMGMATMMNLDGKVRKEAAARGGSGSGREDAQGKGLKIVCAEWEKSDRTGQLHEGAQGETQQQQQLVTVQQLGAEAEEGGRGSEAEAVGRQRAAASVVLERLRRTRGYEGGVLPVEELAAESAEAASWRPWWLAPSLRPLVVTLILPLALSLPLARVLLPQTFWGFTHRAAPDMTSPALHWAAPGYWLLLGVVWPVASFRDLPHSWSSALQLLAACLHFAALTGHIAVTGMPCCALLPAQPPPASALSFPFYPYRHGPSSPLGGAACPAVHVTAPPQLPVGPTAAAVHLPVVAVMTDAVSALCVGLLLRWSLRR